MTLLKPGTIVYSDDKAGQGVMKQIQEVTGVKVPIKVYTDNQSLHATLHTSHILQDKSVRVNIASLRQQVNTKEIEVKWINSKRQIADCLTKQGAPSVNLLCSLKKSFIV